MNKQEVIIRRTECPKCGVTKGQKCVYVQVSVPPHPREWYEDRRYPYTVRPQPNPWDRYALSGSPTKTIHNERRNLDQQRKKKGFPRKPQRTGGLSSEGYQALHAARRWDIEEYIRLREWWAGYGWLIENANALRPDGTVRGDTYCLPPR